MDLCPWKEYRKIILSPRNAQVLKTLVHHIVRQKSKLDSCCPNSWDLFSLIIKMH